ncbi:uncharacterized protein A4U43_C07F23740 [Asparagus officinalis]|uniref:TF-B3 domain-containing protein n=1 Tax=Asparagus officinalis TaxID=4686 RepID=A0A5P1EED8_ASPOF|nr:uncharacterized protein A4U43_C07F23740 [Asparagus officinalis]
MRHPLQCASPRSPSFFRVLQPGFINRLRLPTKFVTNVLATKEIKVESASLVNPIGASWNVEVHTNVDQELYIGGLGWSDLAHAHSLGLGYFLVFRYRGDMAFDFRAFDLSTCEISYPSVSQRVSKKLKQRVPVLVRVKEEDKRSNFSPESTVSCIRNKEKELMKSNAIGGVRFEVELTSYQLWKGRVVSNFILFIVPLS